MKREYEFELEKMNKITNQLNETIEKIENMALTIKVKYQPYNIDLSSYIEEIRTARLEVDGMLKSINETASLLFKFDSEQGR